MSNLLKKNAKQKRWANQLCSHQHGFWLLEFMISVFIISLLCIIVIPIFQTYIVRAKVTEAITLMSGAKSNLAEYYSYYGYFPASTDQVDIVTSGSYVSDVSINHGAIVTKFRDENQKLKNLSLSFRPALAENDLPKVIKWICGYAHPPAHFLIQGENQTDIPPQYLLSTCR